VTKKGPVAAGQSPLMERFSLDVFHLLDDILRVL
jgi:hypothetical protein